MSFRMAIISIVKEGKCFLGNSYRLIHYSLIMVFPGTQWAQQKSERKFNFPVKFEDLSFEKFIFVRHEDFAQNSQNFQTRLSQVCCINISTVNGVMNTTVSGMKWATIKLGWLSCSYCESCACHSYTFWQLFLCQPTSTISCMINAASHHWVT